MKYICLLIFLAVGELHAQKMIAECTVDYRIDVKNDGAPGAVKSSRILYLKGKKIRLDIMTEAFTQKEVYDAGSGSAFIIKEVGANKYLTHLTKEKWLNQFEKFKGVKPVFSTESRTILGYECKKASVSLNGGVKYNLYYTGAIIPSASENPYLSEAIPGFILCYEMDNEKTKSSVSYTASKISFSPVPIALFEIPTSGYRILK